MSNTVNDINKIYCDSPISVRHINMTSLLFVDDKVVSKSRYSVIDSYINLLDVAEKDICLYQHRGSSNYYEYRMNLKELSTISGRDIYGNTLQNITKTNHILFINGLKIQQSAYTIDTENNTITLNVIFPNEEISTIIIYTSDSMQYMGKVNAIDEETGGYKRDWNLEKHSFKLDDYTYLRYIFFKNGEVLTRDYIHKIRDVVTLNTELNIRINPETGEKYMVDDIDYYMLPIDTENVIFNADPGYFSYGPKDNLDLPVPEVHDAEVTFQSIVRLAIDDVRKGFFIREADGDGCVMISGENFETKTAYCTTIKKFSKESYSKNEYFVQVPNAKSILKYISEYDLNKMLMPEILGSFQKLLLDETYDSVQRLKNSRSINYVDSTEINKLIRFMGLDINLTNIDLEKKHALLEELTNFYNIVGTRESYNFYNITNNTGKIVNIDQLFTPIKDYTDTETLDSARRYVDFRTAEELGAVTKTRYEYPFYDLGQVDILANPDDSFTNQPRDEGILNYTGYKIIGEPLIDSRDRISGFTKNDYIELNDIFDPSEKNFKVMIKFKTPNNVATGSDQALFEANGNINYCGLIVYIRSNGHLAFNFPKEDMSGWYGGVTSSFILKPNTWYWVIVERIDKKITSYYSINGRDYIIIGSKTLTDNFVMPTFNYTRIGVRKNTITDKISNIYNGIIDLNEYYIYIDDSLYWTAIPTGLPATLSHTSNVVVNLIKKKLIVYKLSSSNEQYVGYVCENDKIYNDNKIEIGYVTGENHDIPHIENMTEYELIDIDPGEELNVNELLLNVNVEKYTPVNRYIIEPVAGPNKPTMDFGYINEEATSFYDFGYVSDTIKGQWISWTEWDRPKNWYPTNHVDVAVQIPPTIDYKTFMTEFKNTFYDIASAVLYIHSIIEVYTFGDENPSGVGANFGILTTPTYYTYEWAFTNDPRRQDYRYD